MQGGIFPFFTKGRSVKTCNLEYLRDFPYDLIDAAVNEYTDGLLFGFTISYENGRIMISKGVCKYQGDIIIVPATTLDIIVYNQQQYITLVMGECEATEDFSTRAITITLTDTAPSNDKEIELGRFSLEEAATLRCKYTSFADLRTSTNTLDVTHVRYAGLGGHALSPIVMKVFAQEVLAKSSETIDSNFALMCLNSHVVHYETLEWYLAKRCRSEHKAHSFSTLYEELSDILLQHDRAQPSLPPEKPKRKGPTIGY